MKVTAGQVPQRVEGLVVASTDDHGVETSFAKGVASGDCQAASDCLYAAVGLEPPNVTIAEVALEQNLYQPTVRDVSAPLFKLDLRGRKIVDDAHL